MAAVSPVCGDVCSCCLRKDFKGRNTFKWQLIGTADQTPLFVRSLMLSIYLGSSDLPQLCQ